MYTQLTHEQYTILRSINQYGEFMPQETKEKLSEILSQMALLTAACEGNMYHERTVTNEAIYQSAVEIQLKLMEITEK